MTKKERKKCVKTLMLMKKNSYENTRKKERKLCMITLAMMKKKQVRKMIKKRKMDKRLQTLDERNSCSLVDPFILTTPAFKLIDEDFKSAIQEGPTYICDIFLKFEFRRNIIKLKEPKYQTDIYNECTTGKSNWICNSCHNSVEK